MVILFSYSHVFDNFNLCVNTCSEEKKILELNFELPERVYTRSETKTGEAKTEYFQRFKLEPDTYVFSWNIKLEEELNDDKLNYFNILTKFGSTSECTFEKLVNVNDA